MIPKYSMSQAVEQLSTLKIIVKPCLKIFGSLMMIQVIVIYKNATLWLQVALAVN